jgi:hypothetical protein
LVRQFAADRLGGADDRGLVFNALAQGSKQQQPLPACSRQPNG